MSKRVSNCAIYDRDGYQKESWCYRRAKYASHKKKQITAELKLGSNWRSRYVDLLKFSLFYLKDSIGHDHKFHWWIVTISIYVRFWFMFIYIFTVTGNKTTCYW